MILDKDANVYMIGFVDDCDNFEGETCFGFRDSFIMKFSYVGTKQWTRIVGTPGLDR